MARNRTWDNQFGVLVRHTHDVAVVRNRVHDNCLGVFLLDDGQPGGSADNAVLGNQVRRNNHRCAVEEVPNTPFIRGGGIVAAGSQHNLIARNVVRGNRGHTRFSGGIVLVATPAASADGSFSAATHNLVIHNRASRNLPADLVEDRAARRTASSTTGAGRRCPADCAATARTTGSVHRLRPPAGTRPAGPSRRGGQWPLLRRLPAT